MKVAIGIICTVALVAAGIYFDLIVLLVGGIEEIVRGAHAHGSRQGHDIAFGVVHIIGTGLGIFAAGLLIMLVWAVLGFRGD